MEKIFLTQQETDHAKKVAAQICGEDWREWTDPRGKIVDKNTPSMLRLFRGNCGELVAAKYLNASHTLRARRKDGPDQGWDFMYRGLKVQVKWTGKNINLMVPTVEMEDIIKHKKDADIIMQVYGFPKDGIILAGWMLWKDYMARKELKDLEQEDGSLVPTWCYPARSLEPMEKLLSFTVIAELHRSIKPELEQTTKPQTRRSNRNAEWHQYWDEVSERMQEKLKEGPLGTRQI